MTEASFEPRGYLRFDLTQGQVSTPDKRRHLVVPAEIIGAAGNGEDLTSASRRWGEEQGQSIIGLIDGNILELSPERFVTELAHMMATLGWGWCELESWGGVLFVVVKQSPRGGALAILKGFLAGAFSTVANQKFECVAIAEEGASRFLLTGPESVSTVEAWAAEGLTAGEIVSRMQTGAHLSSAPAQAGGS